MDRIKIRSQINFRIEYVFITWIRAGLISHQDLFSFYNRIFLPETEKDESFFNRTIEWLRQNNFIQFNGSEYELLPIRCNCGQFCHRTPDCGIS